MDRSFVCYLKTLYFQQQAKGELETVLKTARDELTPSNGALSLPMLQELGEVLGKTAKILGMMKIESEIERYKSLHAHLKKKIHSLMGIEDRHLTESFRMIPAVVVIDPYFVEMTDDKTSDHTVGFDQLSIPKDPLDIKATNWAHGNLMAALIRNLTSETTIHKVCYSPKEEYLRHWSEVQAPHYASNFQNPVIFNVSMVPYSVSNMVKVSAQGEYILDKSSFAASSYNKEEFNTVETQLSEKFTDYQSGKRLTPEQLAFLQEKEKETSADLTTQSLKRWLIGPKGDRTHLLAAPPLNDGGPLIKKGFHNSRILLHSGKESEERALVALNWNFMTQSLEHDSHSAGDYQDIAVVVPASYVTANLGDNSLPYIGLGGHCSATAILSGITSHVRGRFPELNHAEVRQAILKGADRTFKGYNPTLHGQGMLNLKDALEEARKIQEGKQNPSQ